MRMFLVVAAVMGSLAFGIPSLEAQWLNRRAPGVPRLANGDPDLAAPTPRTAEGKPDLSGVWFGTNNRPALFDLTMGTKPGDIVMTPWAAAIQKQRQRRGHVDDPWGYCMPMGAPRINFAPGGVKVLVTPSVTALLYDTYVGLTFRQIFTDGRSLPHGDIEPTWLGYSVGRWEGDDFIVETNGLRDGGWLDVNNGHPHSDALRLTERFRRLSFGRMNLTITVDDPKAYAKPFSYQAPFQLQPDTDLLESSCESHAKTLERRRIEPAPPEPPSPPLAR